MQRNVLRVNKYFYSRIASVGHCSIASFKHGDFLFDLIFALFWFISKISSHMEIQSPHPMHFSSSIDVIDFLRWEGL